MVNFMTHRDVTFTPSAGTNFVVGANGSGKSSLVCAVCLALGGSADDMERAKDVKSFIRTGSAEATITVTLQGKPAHGDLDIQRRLSTAAGAAGDRWLLNGSQVPHRRIVEVLDEYAIQMDNQCMFLPQEKVGAFTDLRSTEFLSSFMRSVGDRLEERHVELRDMKKRCDGAARERDTAQGALDAADKEMRRLQAYKELAEELERKKAQAQVARLKDRKSVV